LVSPLIAAPLTALVGVGMAIASPVLSGIGVAQNGLVQFALAASLSTALGYAGGRVLAEDSPQNRTHQRGTIVTEQPPRVARLPHHGRSSEITLAGRLVPAHDETKHFKLIGTTGTGKSTAIQEILNAALARGDRAIIADPDGGYLQRFYDPARGDVVLNPFDERSVKWDLFSEINNSYDVEQLSRSLIPDHGADRIWCGYARTFFSAVTRQAHEAGVTDVAELYRLMVVADSKELRTLLRGTPAQPFLDEHNSRMFDSIRSVTSSAVGALDYIAQQKAQGFSVREWVADERPGVLFMPYKAGQIAALRSTISGWMRLAIFEAMDRDEQPAGEDEARRLWFVVDELDALGQIDGLKDALARLRKFGGRCILGFQSIAQVSSTYGNGDAHTIVENCGNTDFALLRQRRRRHGAVRLAAHRRARSVANHGFAESPTHRDDGLDIADRAFQCRTGGSAIANRATARFDGIPQARIGSAMAARAAGCQARLGTLASGACASGARCRSREFQGARGPRA
jgi:hypothetical protein